MSGTHERARESGAKPRSGGARPHRGLYLAPFDELADPVVLVELAIEAEAHGWHGLFLWDHIVYRHPVKAVADPWVALSAIAARTRWLRLGPLVTPLSRRRVQKVARETVSLDRLSGGRLTLGVGLGNQAELAQFGEEEDPRERAHRLDEGLSRLSEFGAAGSNRPRFSSRASPCGWRQFGRTRWPIKRALQWDGLFRIELPGPEALTELADEIERSRHGGLTKFDLVIEIGADESGEPWHQAGATWVLTEFGLRPRAAQVLEVIKAGPE